MIEESQGLLCLTKSIDNVEMLFPRQIKSDKRTQFTPSLFVMSLCSLTVILTCDPMMVETRNNGEILCLMGFNESPAFDRAKSSLVMLSIYIDILPDLNVTKSSSLGLSLRGLISKSWSL